MFTQAKIKLTLWYLLTVIFITGLFSLAIYRSLTAELTRGIRLNHLVPRTFPVDDNQLIFENQLLEDIKHRIAFQILLVDLGIITLSGAASYLMAHKTFVPIEENLEEQKRFVADASHELKTPLTAIKTETEVALRDKSLTAKDYKKLLESNLEEVNKMQSFTQYLLELSRYQNSNQKLPTTKVTLLKMVEDAVSKVASSAKKKGVVITTKVDDAEILANQASLTELISILVDNAIKYNKNAGKVKIRTKLSGKNLFLEVSDTGLGIRNTDLPFIFNRFYRSDTSRNKDVIDGYGLGLSIAKSIVDNYHGTIEVKSMLEEGTTFIVRIPIRYLS